MSIHSNDDQDFLRDALPAFISESVELLDQLEQLLLELEDRPTDRELLDALFRCAHTIKGSAGLFGLLEIVAFTHHVETFLDALREGKTHLTGKISAVLLQSGDQIRRLIMLVDPGRRDTDAGRIADRQLAGVWPQQRTRHQTAVHGGEDHERSGTGVPSAAGDGRGHAV